MPAACLCEAGIVPSAAQDFSFPRGCKLRRAQDVTRRASQSCAFHLSSGPPVWMEAEGSLLRKTRSSRRDRARRTRAHCRQLHSKRASWTLTYDHGGGRRHLSVGKTLRSG
ncbi:hypothetical protein K466DRAFT_405858 [Polyporus arcularius HHB13444]|uniref:Uncharacterized protein n=1 Tax=Polyporus arcularius HHB13444 TaxID=1314778 RepID=A0A5C3PL87_9APHY|nr:hypothetical protein K466DRAFT_405858 [Polyporus arcularius HHB13444]